MDFARAVVTSHGSTSETPEFAIAYPCGSLETASILPVHSGSDAVNPKPLTPPFSLNWHLPIT